MITKINKLLPKEFSPNPFILMRRIEKEKKQSGLIFGFIHGSVVYSKDGVLCGNYKEIRVFEQNTNELLFSEFQIKVQPPDVDIVIIVENREKFLRYFNKLTVDLKLDSKLNYFLTINSLTLDTFNREIRDKEATAIKRILSLRQIWGFGNVKKLESLKKIAKKNTKPYDVAFQKEYEDKKNLLRKKLKMGIRKFKLSEKKYKSMFPLYFAQIWSDTAAGFPEERDKIVLPRPMDLKIRKDVGLDKNLTLR